MDAVVMESGPDPGRTRTPSAITPEIKTLLGRLGSIGEPVRVSVRRDREAVRDECYAAVDRKVARDGGHAVHGWRIFEWPGVLVEAQFHAVWEGTDGRLIDVGAGEPEGSTILFVPALDRVYNGRPINTVRVPLSTSELVREFIHVCDAVFDVMDRGWQTGEGRAVLLRDEMFPLLQRQEKLRREVIRRSLPRNAPCFCGSGKRFKRCCGR